MRTDIKSIKGEIVSIYEEGGSKADAARFIMDKTGLKTTASKDWAKKIYEECSIFGSCEEDDGKVDEFDDLESTPQKLKSDLEFEDKYIYNNEADTYLFLLDRRFGKNIVLGGEKIRSLIKNYSNFDGEPESINKVAINYGIPRKMLIAILKILGITHDSLPMTDEEIAEKSDDELLKEYVVNKKFALNQKIQKEDWKNTKDSAKKWDAFVTGRYAPWKEAIESWEAPKIPTLWENDEYCENSDIENTFLCVLTDTHIGELTKNSWSGKTFNTPKAIANIVSYIRQIDEKLSERKVVPTKCQLVIMGDILNSCVDGETRRGTKLHNDIVNAELFKVGMNVLVAFVDALKQIFPTVNINCIKGNHDSFLIQSVYFACEKYFETVENLNWKICDYWIDSFKINNCYFMYAHGKDDDCHISLPKSNPKKFESFVQSLLLSKIEELVGVKSKYFISGHLHSYQQIENNDFESIQVPSMSGSADVFADTLGYRSKARQNCFIVGQDHIEEVFHFYFE